MAKRPARLGAKPRLERKRDYDAQRRQSKPWRSWYGTAEWKAIRHQQLQREPLCQRCLREDKVEAATVVNHVHPHRGDRSLFFGGPFESLCKPHHDSEVQREERAAARAINSARPG